MVGAALALASCAAPPNASEPRQEAILGDSPEEPYRDIPEEIKPPEMAVEGLREAPVIEVEVQPIVPVELPTVVVKAYVAQGVPAEGQLASIIARYFVEQPLKALRVVMCESTGDPTIVSGPHYGLWQFTLGTWQSVGGVGLPSNASIEEQVLRAHILYEREGWRPWPVCGLK